MIASIAESIIKSNTRDLTAVGLVSDSIRIVMSGNWLKEED